MASITGSTQSPFSSPLLQDVNYDVSVAWPLTATTAVTPSVFFANLDWPTVGHFALSVYSTALTNNAPASASTVALQWGTDNSNFVNVTPLSTTVITATSASVSQLVLLPPPSNTSVGYYVRAQGTTNGVGLVGTFGINTLF